MNQKPIRSLLHALAYLWHGLGELLTRLAIWRLEQVQARRLADLPGEAFQLHRLEATPGRLELEASTLPEVVRVLAIEMAKVLDDVGAENYVQMEVRPRVYPFGAYFLTVSRAEGEMPGARAARLAQELETLQSAVSSLRESLVEISRWRDDCHNYDDDVGHEPRTFDEETVEAIENYARRAIGEADHG